MDFLVDFIEKCDCFEISDKLKLLLFILSNKPATFAPLKIYPKNLEDKSHFEKHLNEHNFFPIIGKPKSFEEIDKISGNKIIWSIKGTWYGYDLFKDKKAKELFKKYIYLVKKQKHDEADFIAGKIYDYPVCCVRNYIKENKLDWLKKKYSYYKYYKKQHDLERKFPFVIHSPCSLKCKATQKLNRKNKQIIKKHAPRFYKEFTKKKSFKSDFIVEGENNFITGIKEQKLWSAEKGHDYNIVSKNKFNKHNYMFSYLSKNKYEKGTILQGRAVIQHNYADFVFKKTKKIIKNLVHVRHFKALGRKY